MTEINITRRQRQVNIPDDTSTYILPIASETTLGGIKVGNNLTIEEDGTLNAAEGGYTLPVATASTLGGIKIGSGLNINDGVTSVITDAILSTSSSNPIQNATVAQSINTISNSIDGIENDIDAIEDDIDDITTDVGTAKSDITNLTTDLGTLDGTVSSLSSTVSGYSSAISENTSNITSLTNRMGTAENNITNLSTAVNGLTDSADTEITYSYLLPVSTWTDGSITLEKRGKLGVLYLDIEGSLTLASGGSTIIYNFPDLNLYLAATAVVMTDAGCILAKVDDETSNLTLENMSGSSITVTKVKGSVPLVMF